MLKVGITGNIGSGKTRVCRIFETMGVPVFYADREAALVYSDGRVQQQVVEAFGSEMFDEAGNLQRQKLASIVFSDEKALAKINAIIHPAVLRRYEQWLEDYNDKAYTLHEAAILFEHHLEEHMDLVITVTAPEAVRLRRVMERDGVPEAEVRNRMKNQWPDALKTEKSDFVIYNDDDDFLVSQIDAIHQKLIQKCKEK
jgi:dephospho-CoA kinase